MHIEKDRILDEFKDFSIISCDIVVDPIDGEKYNFIVDIEGRQFAKFIHDEESLAVAKDSLVSTRHQMGPDGRR